MSPAAALSVRLARAVCDLDEVAQALRAEQLSEFDAELLYPSVAHLALAYDAIQDVVFELETYGLSSHTVRHGSRHDRAPDLIRVAA